MTKSPKRSAVHLFAVVALVSLLGACSSSSSSKARPADDPKPPEVKVTLTASGCDPQSFTLAPGPVLFVVTSPAASASGSGPSGAQAKAVTEMEVQSAQGHEINDVEGVQPGRTRSFLVKLEQGKTYRVRCPEEQTPWGTITVKP